jgi:tRNA-specific 2-thiouridylase
MISSQKVIVAMSGGVDSSVAAAYLKDQGYHVIGLMLRLWSEPGSENLNRCCTPNDLALARRVAAQLDIPFYAIDAKNIFYQTVVNNFINGYAQGITPNPCLVCNQHIRWKFLLDRALALGANYLATGHYARLRYPHKQSNFPSDDLESSDLGPIELLRGIDPSKDQSYVLHMLHQKQLSHALFPLGNYTKSEVRKMASDYNLPVATRADSQDLCFLGDGDYGSFLLRNAPEVHNPGPIINSDGLELGEHRGLAFYTIGQRKGLGISAKQPLYVIRKDVTKNALVIGPQDQLGKYKLITDQVNWISGIAPQKPFTASVKIRYKAEEVDGLISPEEGGGTKITFNNPLRDITPGQAAVFYDGEVCLGGGMITS